VGLGPVRQLACPSPHKSVRGARGMRMGVLGSAGYGWQREGTASVVASVGTRRCPSTASGSASGVGGDCCAADSLAEN